MAELGQSCIFVGKQGGRRDRQMCPELEEREKNGRSIIVLTLSAAAAKLGTRARGESWKVFLGLVA